MQVLSVGLLLGACGAEGSGPDDSALAPEDSDGAEELDDEVLSFTGSSQPGNLSPAEWEAYRVDLSYIHGLMPPGAAVSFNHNDERQHEFVRLRLKLAGKTPENSPELFARLDQLRETHEADHLVVGTFAAVDMPKSASSTIVVEQDALANSEGRKTIHEFLSLDLIPNGNDPPVSQKAVVVLSEKSDENFPTVFSMKDVGLWGVNWDQLAPLVYEETYGPENYGTVQTLGDLTLEPTEGADHTKADSYTITDRLGAPVEERYMVRNHHRTIELEPAEVEIPFPVDPADPDECYDICLNRNWAGDCDLDLTGIPGSLTIPMKGCVSLAQNSAGSHSFDPAVIADRAANGCPDEDCGGITVILQDTGGGCNTDASGMIQGDIQAFWSGVYLEDNNDRLCWDLTGPDAMVFDPTCRQVQDHVTLMINVPLPVINNGGQQVARDPYLTVSNDPADGDFQCITITNSCLAEGTMVELAQGDVPVPIESIGIGTMASNPYAASGGLTVMDVAKGVEDVPMVRIEDEAGHSLLLTTKHPVLVPGKGMVQAEDLVVGDAVVTKTGTSRLVEIRREDFDGSVHNLKVGSDTEAVGLGTDQTVFFANGLLVGDGQVQSKYESIEMAASKKVDLDTLLTPGWKKDYRNSARRARAERRATR